MNKYTAEQVEDTRRITPGVRGEMLGDLVALLRERESAKAAVTDEVIWKAARALFNARKNNFPLGTGAERRWNRDKNMYFLDAQCALEAVAPMLASARVPDEKEDLDPVRLRREGRVATEWERGFNEGWNACRAAMLAAPTKD